MMKRIHIIGRKNQGKTTLMVELIAAMRDRGLRVGSIKHTHHQHELDLPGKDSWRHRQAGAAVAGIVSPGLSAVFFPQAGQDEGGEPPDRYAPLAECFRGCDLVLVEGNQYTAAPRVEVWRAETGSEPLCLVDPTIQAIVSDDRLPAGLEARCFARSDLHPLIEWMTSPDGLSFGEEPTVS